LDICKHNEEAWDKQVREESVWTVPVTSQQVARARGGSWSVLLTPSRPVPESWFPGFPDLQGCRILGLAAGGGQQGPIFAAAGATVTVFDNSHGQLGQDRLVADRENLQLQTVAGDMTDLSCFADSSFDLVFHPVSNCFIPDPQQVWQEAYRVLRPGGLFLSGIMNPDYYIFDFAVAEKEGLLKVRHPLPYSDIANLNASELATQTEAGEPLEFSHTMDTQIGQMLLAGFQITGFYEDRYEEEIGDTVSKFIPVCFAIQARKPG